MQLRDDGCSVQRRLRSDRFTNCLQIVNDSVRQWSTMPWQSQVEAQSAPEACFNFESFADVHTAHVPIDCSQRSCMKYFPRQIGEAKFLVLQGKKGDQTGGAQQASRTRLAALIRWPLSFWMFRWFGSLGDLQRTDRSQRKTANLQQTA